MARAYVGISGWSYPGWRGGFYPSGLAHARELEHAASKLSSVEINGSFYSLQRPESYACWRDATPEGFVFAVKGSRFITHMKKLRDVDAALANFFASGVLALGPKLGPILWQLPPNLAFDPERLAGFFDRLPRTTVEAARIAKRHDARVSGRSFLRALVDQPIRHAIEVRHPSFVDPAFVELLRAHRVALCVADSPGARDGTRDAGRWPLFEDVTADFVYVRLHGDVELYASGYSDDALERWAAKARGWMAGRTPRGTIRVAAPADKRPRDVYVYFDNDARGHAPFDAACLAQKIGVRWPPKGVVPPEPRPRARPVTPRSIVIAPSTRSDPRWAPPRSRARASTASPRSRPPTRATARPREAR